MSHRIQLRDCTLFFLGGLAGSGAVDEPTTAPVEGATTFKIGSTNIPLLNLTTKVPLGVRFTIAGETDASAVHIVTGRDVETDVTGSITFTPALGAGTYAKTAAITYQTQELEVKLGDGEAKWSENKNFKYDSDRGMLDTVRQGDDVPLELDITATWEHVRTGTGELVTPIDALNNEGGAADWVSSSADLCEPYAVDVKLVHEPKCAGTQKETFLFPDFRAEKKAFDIKNASISITGKCNVTEPTITRG